jgi:hypothetical protein
MKRKQTCGASWAVIPQDSLACFLTMPFYSTRVRIGYVNDYDLHLTDAQKQIVEECCVKDAAGFQPNWSLYPKLTRYHAHQGNHIFDQNQLPQQLRQLESHWIEIEDGNLLPCCLQDLRASRIRNGSLDHCKDLQTLDLRFLDCKQIAQCSQLKELNVKKFLSGEKTQLPSSLTSLTIPAVDCLTIDALSESLCSLNVDILTNSFRLQMFTNLQTLTFQNFYTCDFDCRLLPPNLTSLTASLDIVSWLPSSLKTLHIPYCKAIISDTSIFPSSLESLHFDGKFTNVDVSSLFTNLRNICTPLRHGTINVYKLMFPTQQQVLLKSTDEAKSLFETSCAPPYQIVRCDFAKFSRLLSSLFVPDWLLFLQIHVTSNFKTYILPLPKCLQLEVFELSTDSVLPVTQAFVSNFFVRCPQITTINDTTGTFCAFPLKTSRV